MKGCARTLLIFLAATLLPAAGQAATVLNVDLSSSVRPVTHVASGSLYGLLEKQPADLTGLVAPLHPNVFNNPAADVQQPIGDAIVVAGRVAPLGARVSIRLADWFPSWPYAFTNTSDWLNKIGQTVSRRQSGGLTNIYAYEIWNEPDGTWKSTTLAFNDFWKQTYAQLRQLDPTIKITGPSTSYYNASYIQSLLSYCKTNDCLPDIVGWHELSGGNLTGDVQAYRALEKQLGVGPLPITINEYSGKDDLSVEGQPGASAPLIAKFERLGVDSACISFWDVGHPGRLGSLLATDTQQNGGWWFYKWYGDMSGNMVATTPPTTANVTGLDGFANLDTAAQSASVLFGGVNDGTVQIVVKGFAAAPFFGSKVHVVVEHTPFVNRTTVVKATDVVSTADVAIAADQITVSVAGANNTDGYRVSLTPVATGGAGGAGGVAGTGGAAGGRAGAGGGAGSAGHGAAGQSGSGGSSTGGVGQSGGAGEGGAAGAGGGAGQSGGAAGTSSGGSSGNGGAAAGAAGHDATGCSCAVESSGSTPIWPSLIVLALVLRRRPHKKKSRDA